MKEVEHGLLTYSSLSQQNYSDFLILCGGNAPACHEATTENSSFSVLVGKVMQKNTEHKARKSCNLAIPPLGRGPRKPLHFYQSK